MAVAEANGFKVVTGADGSKTSVPVTDAAKKAVAAASKVKIQTRGSVQPQGYGSVEGPCGVSWINIQRSGITTMTTVSTGYTVRLPTTGRYWGVALYGFAGIATFGFSAPATPTGPTWSGTQKRSYGSGGYGEVVVGSQVTLIDGALCLSGSPSTTF